VKIKAFSLNAKVRLSERHKGTSCISHSLRF